MKANFVTVTRPDGQKLELNINQIVYVMSDPVDESGKKTEIVTTQGAFLINKKFADVMAVIAKGQGDL